MLINLQKRLLSSIEAFHRTLRAHRRFLQKLADKPPTQASRENSPQLWRQRQMALEEACAADDVRAELGEDDVEAEQEDTLEAATAPAATGPARPSSQELGLLDQVEAVEETISAVQGVQQIVLNSLLIRKASPPGQMRGFKAHGSTRFPQAPVALPRY